MRMSCKQKTLSISNSLVFLALYLQIPNWLWITSKKIQLSILIWKRIWLIKWLLTILIQQLEVVKILIKSVFSVFSVFTAYLALRNKKCSCNIIAWIPFFDTNNIKKGLDNKNYWEWLCIFQRVEKWLHLSRSLC